MPGVRWKALFDDLEAQADAAARLQLDDEVRDRSRREGALVRTVDRLRAATGTPVVLGVDGAGAVHGLLLDVGPDWLLLEEQQGRDVLVPLAGVLTVAGLGRRTSPADGIVAGRLDLRWALGGLARDRTSVQVLLRDASVLTGTLDRVGADHVDLAEHAPGEPRRASAVRGVRLVALEALVLLRPV